MLRPLILFLLVMALAWPVSAVGIKGDDFGYVMWATQTSGDLLAPLRGPDFLVWWRPLNMLSWWLAGQIGSDAILIRLLSCTFWASTVVLLTEVAWRRGGRGLAGCAVVLLVCNQVFVDLLLWKSWLTTIASGFALVGGLAVLTAQDRPRPWPIAAAGVSALGFKELAAVALGWMVASERHSKWITLGGTILLVAGIVAMLPASGKAQAGMVISNIKTHLGTLGGWAWATPLLMLSGPRKTPTWAAAGTALLVLVPAKMAGLGVATAIGWSLFPHWRWAAALAGVWAAPMLYIWSSRQYMLEGWLVLSCFVVMRRVPRIPWWVLALSVIAAVPEARDYHGGRQESYEIAQQQRAFLEGWDPPQVDCLYHPDPMYSFDVDALEWAHRGARWCEQPPKGTSPKYTGPLSGIWGDLEDRSKE